MIFTKHAITRCQQRGIPKDFVELIMEFGTPRSKPGGAVEYRVCNKDRDQIISHLKHLINEVDRISNKAVLLLDGLIITVYHKRD